MPRDSYDQKVRGELRTFRDMTNVHDLPAIFHYWSNKYLRPKMETFGFSGPNGLYCQYIEKVARRRGASLCRVLSVGAGNCDTEVTLASTLAAGAVTNVAFTCLDLNDDMLERGARLAAERNLSHWFSFLRTDVNSWDVSAEYDVVIANQSLHHFVELETLFEKVYRSLAADGYFLSSDMIGRNGHMRWPEALEIVQALWSTLDDRHKWNHQLGRQEPEFLDWDCSKEGFEGIRAQDVLALLMQRFHFEIFFAFGNLINVFVDRGFGPNFDETNEHDRDFIDIVAKLDEHFIESGRIKPTQMLAAMTKEPTGPTRIHRHLTPEFCARPVP